MTDLSLFWDESGEAGTTRAACESAAVETATSAGACAAMEHISEDISEHIVHIAALKMKFLIAAALAGMETAVLESSPASKAAETGTACAAIKPAARVRPGVTCLVEGRKAELIV